MQKFLIIFTMLISMFITSCLENLNDPNPLEEEDKATIEEGEIIEGDNENPGGGNEDINGNGLIIRAAEIENIELKIPSNFWGDKNAGALISDRAIPSPLLNGVLYHGNGDVHGGINSGDKHKMPLKTKITRKLIMNDVYAGKGGYAVLHSYPVSAINVINLFNEQIQPDKIENSRGVTIPLEHTFYIKWTGKISNVINTGVTLTLTGTPTPKKTNTLIGTPKTYTVTITIEPPKDMSADTSEQKKYKTQDSWREQP